MRIRTPVTLDRQRLHKDASSFTSDGGANTFIESLMEVDSRFLKKATDKWSVIVLLITDSGDSHEEIRIDAYNKFAAEFRARQGVSHAIVVKGRNASAYTEIAKHFVGNTGGIFEEIILANLVPDKMKAIGERIAATYKPYQP